MLSLDDTLWGRLDQAYGKASNIPNLLRALAASTSPSSGQEEEPWHSLWSSLCHQGDAYTASYAAVPHIIHIASNAKTSIDFSFFALPAAIEVARYGGHGPEVPGEIADDYHRALARLGECASMHRDDPWNRTMLLSIAAAQAVAKGDIELADVLLNLDDDWVAKIVSDDR